MAEILSKREFAAQLGVKPSALSNYIARGKLTAPALRPDGSIDSLLARQQLGRGLNLQRSAVKAPAVEKIVAQQSPEELSAHRTLVRARAISAAVAAEQARRKLSLDNGKYLLAEEAAAQWGRALDELLRAIDSGLPELEILLALDEEGAGILAEWWRSCRERIAERLTQTAMGLPELLEDAAA